MRNLIIFLSFIIYSLRINAQTYIADTFEFGVNESKCQVSNCYNLSDGVLTITYTFKDKNGDVNLSLKYPNDVADFSNYIEQIHNKKTEWLNTARNNNIQNFSKKMPISAPSIQASYFGYIDNVMAVNYIKPEISMTINLPNYYFTLTLSVTDMMNYYKSGFVICNLSSEDFDKLRNSISENNIKIKFQGLKNKANTDGLFN